jgi:hypothetical protein
VAGGGCDAAQSELGDDCSSRCGAAWRGRGRAARLQGHLHRRQDLRGGCRGSAVLQEQQQRPQHAEARVGRSRRRLGSGAAISLRLVACRVAGAGAEQRCRHCSQQACDGDGGDWVGGTLGGGWEEVIAGGRHSRHLRRRQLAGCSSSLENCEQQQRAAWRVRWCCCAADGLGSGQL